jgi:hypothetical protein
MEPQQIPIASGALWTQPFDLTLSGGMLQILLVQVSYTQDFSLRAWVSQYANGMPYPPGYIAVLKTANLPIVIHTGMITPLPGTWDISVPVTACTLNVFNLTNEANILGYSLI